MSLTTLWQRLTDNMLVVFYGLSDARHMTPGRVWEGIKTGVRALYMGVKGADQDINEAVIQWDGVSKHLHRYGGTEWRLGRRELGHVHGSY